MAFTKSLRLLFIFPFVSATLVAPPTNVTLTCRNLQNILSWNYDNDVPGVRFKVSIRSTAKISGCPKKMWVNESSSRQADLSLLSDPDIMYLVDVKAVLGKDESVSSPEDGIEFSYFSSALSGQKCLLDIPPVDITTQDQHHMLVEFKHPWLVYKDGLYRCNAQKKKNELPNFKYTINVVGQDKPHSSDCEEDECKIRLQVDMKQDKHCLKINGELELMTVVTTKEFCTEKAPPPLNRTGLIAGITIAILAALAVIAVMVFWKQTRPTLVKINSLVIRKTNKPEFQHLPDVPSPVTVSPFPMPPEDPPVKPVIIPKTDEDYDQRIKLSPNNQAFTEEREEESTSDDPYMSGQKLDSDSEEPDFIEIIPSPYECRGVVVELAPEDRAEGYRA
ncbi:interferon gamma receptor 1-like isoform X1 [Poecilia latipinna]|nr:PREDICTED: interferon gamma receptor 1-like isoform X1 [Poecilia latipinna]